MDTTYPCLRNVSKEVKDRIRGIIQNADAELTSRLEHALETGIFEGDLEGLLEPDAPVVYAQGYPDHFQQSVPQFQDQYGLVMPYEEPTQFIRTDSCFMPSSSFESPGFAPGMPFVQPIYTEFDPGMVVPPPPPEPVNQIGWKQNFVYMPVPPPPGREAWRDNGSRQPKQTITPVVQDAEPPPEQPSLAQSSVTPSVEPSEDAQPAKEAGAVIEAAPSLAAPVADAGPCEEVEAVQDEEGVVEKVADSPPKSPAEDDPPVAQGIVVNVVSSPEASHDLTPSQSEDEEIIVPPVVEVQEPALKRIRLAAQISRPASGSLVGRCTSHPDFKQLFDFDDTLWYEIPAREKRKEILGIHCDCIYVGKHETQEYNNSSLARLTVVDIDGVVLIQETVRQEWPILDLRADTTNLTLEDLEKGVDISEARSRLFGLMSPTTILIGHSLHWQMKALKLKHKYVVDTALLFGIAPPKRGHFHELSHLANTLLGSSGSGATWNASTALDLVLREMDQGYDTPPFPVARVDDSLQITRIPLAVQEHDLNSLFGQYGEVVDGPTYTLNMVDATEWLGKAVVQCKSPAVRDWVFDNLTACVDVHVSWNKKDTQFTKEALFRTFAQFGVVVDVRMPYDPITRKPRGFAFVTFQWNDDAQQAVKQKSIEVTLGDETRTVLAQSAMTGAESKRVTLATRSKDQVSVEVILVTKM